jgi:hypothetical protein
MLALAHPNSALRTSGAPLAGVCFQLVTPFVYQLQIALVVGSAVAFRADMVDVDLGRVKRTTSDLGLTQWASVTLLTPQLLA